MVWIVREDELVVAAHIALPALLWCLMDRMCHNRRPKLRSRLLGSSGGGGYMLVSEGEHVAWLLDVYGQNNLGAGPASARSKAQFQGLRSLSLGQRTKKYSTSAFLFVMLNAPFYDNMSYCECPHSVDLIQIRNAGLVKPGNIHAHRV